MGRMLRGMLTGAWAVVRGIAQALGVVVYVLCAIVEAMAVMFLLAGMGGRRY